MLNKIFKEHRKIITFASIVSCIGDLVIGVLGLLILYALFTSPANANWEAEYSDELGDVVMEASLGEHGWEGLFLFCEDDSAVMDIMLPTAAMPSAMTGDIAVVRAKLYDGESDLHGYMRGDIRASHSYVKIHIVMLDAVLAAMLESPAMELNILAADPSDNYTVQSDLTEYVDLIIFTTGSCLNQ